MATSRRSSGPFGGLDGARGGARKKAGGSGKMLLPGQSGRGARIWRVVKLLLVAGFVLGLAGAAVVAGLVVHYTSDPSLPTIDRVSDYHPKVVTRVLASDGQLIGELYEERRTVIPRERIPRVLINAFVDAEDAQFFEHKGLNYMGMVRAVIQSAMQRGHLRGASTITQQLVKTYVLKSSERSLKRKIQEMYLTLRLERKLQDKEEILWIYLNQIYFGHNRYGIEEAARFYFGKSASDVNAAEAAVLASLPKAPEEISPRRNAERAKNRQRYVLSQMARYHHISQDEAQHAADAPIQLVKEPPPLGALAPEFVDEAEKELVKRYGQAQIPFLGLNVRTTCNVEVQRAARVALETNLQKLDERNGYRGKVRHLEGAARTQHVEQLTKEFPAGPPVGKIVEGVIDKVLDTDAQSGWAMVSLGAVTGNLPLGGPQDRYNPKGNPPTKRFAPGDTVRVRIARTVREGPILALENGPQGAAFVLEPETRYVLAMIGGYGYGRGMFDRALRARRQPGSAFKTIVFATAFDSKKYTAASVLNDSPQVYDLPGLAPWMPKNASDHKQFMGPVRLRVALAQSLNTVASQLIYDLKPEPVIKMARALGITSELESNYALALGSSVVSLVELTNAYATLSARGRRAEPQWLLQIGNEGIPAGELTQAISPELAFVTASVLQSVIDEGTARSIKDKLHRPAAGKTGTTNSNRDAWFVGFTPEVAAGVWVGFDDMKPLGDKEQGARSALPVWNEIMQTALRDRRIVPFVQPAGVVVQRIDPKTGQLAAAGAPAIDEVFLENTAPTEQAIAPGESDPNTFNME